VLHVLLVRTTILLDLDGQQSLFFRKFVVQRQTNQHHTKRENKLNFACALQSLAFSDAAFSCDWLLTSKQFKKDLAFVVMRAQKPLELEAYKHYNLSFVTLISVLKNAYSLFTFFRTINED
jgi:7tm Odorant receptor